MTIDQTLYVTEMDALIAEAKRKFIAESYDVEVYTISIWTDLNAAVSAVNFDTIDNSDRQRRESNDWNRKQFDKYMLEGDEEFAKLFQPVEGRFDNPANFEFSQLAVIRHRSFAAADKPILLAGGDRPIDDIRWPVLEALLDVVSDHARELYRDLKLHPDAMIAVNSPYSWYDNEIPIQI